MRKTFVLVLSGLLIAMEIVLSRFLAPQTEFIRISFSFIPIFLAAVIFGPVWGGMVAAVSDLLGATLVLRAPVHLGITLCAFLTGLVYGLILYKKPKTISRIFCAEIIIALFVNIALKTFWLSNLYHEAYTAILGQRVILSAIMLPIHITTIYLVWRNLGKYIETNIIAKIRLEKSANQT